MKIRQAVLLIAGAMLCMLIVGLMWLSYVANPQSSKYIYIWQRYWWPRQLAESGSLRNFTGETVDYREDGSVLARISYRDGKLDGHFCSYNPNGMLDMQMDYQNGAVIEGTTVYWNHYPDRASYRDEVKDDEVFGWFYDKGGRCSSCCWRLKRENPQEYHLPSGICIRYETASSEYIFKIEINGKDYFVSDDLTTPECKAVIDRALPLLDPFYQAIVKKQIEEAKKSADQNATQTDESVDLSEMYGPATEE